MTNSKISSIQFPVTTCFFTFLYFPPNSFTTIQYLVLATRVHDGTLFPRCAIRVFKGSEDLWAVCWSTQTIWHRLHGPVTWRKVTKAVKWRASKEKQRDSYTCSPERWWILASFPGLPSVQYLLTYSMRNLGSGKVWNITICTPSCQCTLHVRGFVVIVAGRWQWAWIHTQLNSQSDHGYGILQPNRWLHSLIPVLIVWEWDSNQGESAQVQKTYSSISIFNPTPCSTY